MALLEHLRHWMDPQQVGREIHDYCVETTLHGCRYVVEGRNNYEKVCWAFLIIAGFIYSGWIISGAIHTWETSPLQTTVDQVSLPIQELPFPAITVCDQESLEIRIDRPSGSGDASEPYSSGGVGDT